MSLAQNLDLLMFLAAIAALLSGYPVAFTLAGIALLFAFIGVQLGVFDTALLGLAPQRIFGVMNNQVLIAVPLFVFMGVMLEKSKVAEQLLSAMAALFGPLRGGLGISVIVVGALLAASTGIVGATVVTMGLLSLPIMLKRGYSPELATGSIAASGTLGQIIPPSIVLVLLGDVMSNAYQQAQRSQGVFTIETMSVGDLFAGSLIPGLMLVALYILYQVFIAMTRPHAAPATPPEEREQANLRELIGALAAPLLLMVAVLGSILAGLATPTQAAAVGATGATLIAAARAGDRRGFNALTHAAVIFGAIALVVVVAMDSFFDLRPGRPDANALDTTAVTVAFGLCALAALGFIAAIYRLWPARIAQEVTRDTTRITSMVFVILIGATVFSLVFRGLGGEELVESILSGSAQSVLSFVSAVLGGVGMNETASGLLQSDGATATVALLVVMLVMFVLGFFLDFIEITFVVVPLVAPPLLMLGVDPVWLGVMMAINLQTSFLTPPFGFALFYLRGVAPASVTTAQIYRGAAPFVGIQIIGLLIVALFPALATWLPSVVVD